MQTAWSAKNRGVAERDARGREEMDKEKDVRGILASKAELYERLRTRRSSHCAIGRVPEPRTYMCGV